MPKAGSPANHLEMEEKTEIFMYSQDNRTLEDKERDWEIGQRAEEVASFYLKLNGFFILPNFAVHRDYVNEYIHTDADILAVRFPHSIEVINKKQLYDDPVIARIAGSRKRLFLIVEVKSGVCAINRKWTNEGWGTQHMQTAIKRMGFARVGLSAEIAQSLMGETTTWEDADDKVVHLCMGGAKNDSLRHQQILFSDFADFFIKRLVYHPLKVPSKSETLRIWGKFGSKLITWQQEQVQQQSSANSELIIDLSSEITKYIYSGS
jgi:hypothetical protein